MAETERSWYSTKQEIEENSPSRIDGIDTKQETFQRWSYTTFLQELGRRLKVPQKSIWTSIVLSQRFFTLESLAKNDSRTISIICMFIAGKLEGSPRPVNDVIVVAYRVLNDKDPLKQEYEELKQNVLTGEKFVMSTLRFDFDIEQPYDLLLDWVKRSVKIEKDGRNLCQAACNFVNDGLRSSLCLQFKASQIAAAAIFLGSRLVKVKLPWDGEKVWWREFNVTKRQLCEISHQMLGVYELEFLVDPVKYDKFDNRKQIKDDEAKSCRGIEDQCKGNVGKVADKSRNVVDDYISSVW